MNFKNSENSIDIVDNIYDKKSNNIVLTEEQKLAFDKILNFINDKEHKYFSFRGYAGTGKTTVLIELVKHFKYSFDRIFNRKIDVTLSAPTNKACKVISNKLKDSGLSNVNVATIHSLLAIKPKIDYNTGVEEYVPDKYAEQTIYDYNLIIIDESSMINQSLYNYIRDAVDNYNMKVLFVGDPAQLPPVNEDESDTLHLPLQIELTNVVRYGSEIEKLATYIRQNLEEEIDYELLFEKYECDKINILKRRDFEEKKNEYFTDEKYLYNPDYARILAYTNASVKSWNTKVRKLFYNGTDKFIVGDKVVANDTCLDEMGDKIVFPNSEEAIVNSVEIANFKSYLMYILKVRMHGNIEDIKLRVIHEDFEQDLLDDLERLKNKEKWKEYYALKKFFHDINYSHALTIHKSQGSTFNNVFIDVKNILQYRNKSNLKEINQLMYVAITRASDKIFLRL